MFIIVFAILGAAVMLLWNALIPDLFHGPTLDYWQALGLLVLTRILLGRGGRRGWKRMFWKRWGRRGAGWARDWGRGWAPRGGNWEAAEPEGSSWGKSWSTSWCDQKDWRFWQDMSPEERRKMKQEWKEHIRKEWANYGNRPKREEEGTK